MAPNPELHDAAPAAPASPGGRARRERRSGPRQRGSRRRRRRDRRGVALVMVLGAIAVLTVFLTELQEETSSELSAALADRDALRAEYYARSAVNLSRLLIAAEPSISTAIGPMLAMVGVKGKFQVPVWKFTDLFLGPFNGQASATGAAPPGGLPGVDLSAGKGLGLTGGGRFELKIVDEESKINVNRAADDVAIQDQLAVAGQLVSLMAPTQYNPLFEGRDGDNQFSDRGAICAAIIDWADARDQLFNCDLSANASGSTGAEDNFYQSIGLDYQRKNAPYDSIDELRLVRGMSDDFWATFVDPDPNDPNKRVLTVWGNRKRGINVSSASPQALLAFTCNPNLVDPATPLCSNMEQMTSFLTVMSLAQSLIPGGIVFPTREEFYSAMTQASGASLGAMVGGMFKQMGVEPVKFKSSKKETLKLLSNDTKFLSIYADGIVPGNKRETRVRIHAVLDMTGASKLSETPLQPSDNQGTGGTGAAAAFASAQQSPWEQTVRSNPAGTVVYYRIE